MMTALLEELARDCLPHFQAMLAAARMLRDHPMADRHNRTVARKLADAVYHVAGVEEASGGRFLGELALRPDLEAQRVCAAAWAVISELWETQSPSARLMRAKLRGIGFRPAGERGA